MYPDSLLFFIVPVGLYLGLALLPRDRGLPASVAALGAAALFLIASFGTRGGANDLLDREFQAIFAGTLTGAATGAVACHRLGRGRAMGWLPVAAGFGIALGATALIIVLLVRVL